MNQQVYLIRHGETKWSLSGQHTSTTDIPLTENGKKAAKNFEPFFKELNFAKVLTSPLERAKTTCQLAGLEKVAEVDPDLMEWNYGDYEGLTSKEIQEKKPSWLLFKEGCPNGETPEDVQKRVDRLIEKIRSINGDVALFAHGHILRVLAVRWIDLPVITASNLLLDTASISILSYYKDFPAIKQWNALVNEP